MATSVNDLIGQLEYLGLMGACIPYDYWRFYVSSQAMGGNQQAAQILLSVLRRITIRHTKAQERAGALLVELPPIMVEPMVLPWASEAEQLCYQSVLMEQLSRYEQMESRVGVGGVADMRTAMRLLLPLRCAPTATHL